MPIEHRPAFKCDEEPDKPVWSGLIEPKGNVRHFHGPDRFLECWGTISSIHAGVTAKEEPGTEHAFLDSLKPGEMVQATCLGNSKTHIVVLRHKPAPEEKKSLEAWYANPLCETQDRWLWTPRMGKALIGRETCKPCDQRHRGLGSPPLRGAITAAVQDSDGLVLPLAWKEVPAEGHPDDGPATDDNPGRRELKRWQRGLRYVRLVEVLWKDDEEETERKNRYSHALRTGWAKEPKTDEEQSRWNYQGCLKTAREIMLLGGAPKGSGSRQWAHGRTVDTEGMWRYD